VCDLWFVRGAAVRQGLEVWCLAVLALGAGRGMLRRQTPTTPSTTVRHVSGLRCVFDALSVKVIAQLLSGWER